MRRLVIAIVYSLVALLFVVGAQASAAPSASPAVDDASVRAAKVGLGWFLLEHVDRPTRVSSACPSLSIESIGWYLERVGLFGSARAYGVEVVWDTRVGGGLVALRCGVDIAAAADPAGSTAWALDVATLDGQATFAQYAVQLGGRDVVVSVVPDLDGQIASRCTNSGRSCTVALEVHGLLLTLRLSGLPGETGDALARELVVAVVDEVVSNLTAVPAPS